jgi:hypothetical protein
MRWRWTIVFLVLILAACAGRPAVPPSPTAGGDPVYRFTPGSEFRCEFSERLEHVPRSANEPATHRATKVDFQLTVRAVRPDGAAHLHFSPVGSRVTIRYGDKPAAVQEGWADRGRDRYDLSPGVRYLREIGEAGLHAVVSAEGFWLRDFRGGEPPAEFLTQDVWTAPPSGLTVYPRRERAQTMPSFFGVYVPADWRKRPAWKYPYQLAPHPPMTGLMPLEFTAKLTQREGSLLYLEGQAVAAGRSSPKSPFGLVMLGDVTLDLRFQKAFWEARFDLNLGLPIESRQEFRWATQRYADALGEIISDDAQILTVRISAQ